jgi:NTP pyrophosphatase (non-canonical NTP hydrolase)
MGFIRNLFARIWSSLLNTSMAKWIIGIFSSPSPHNAPIVQSVGGQQDEKATQQTAQLSEPDHQMSCDASELTSENRKKALFTAIKNQNISACQLLLENFGNLPEEDKLSIILAVIQSNTPIYKEVIENARYKLWVDDMFTILEPYISAMSEEHKVKIFSAAAKKYYLNTERFGDSWVAKLKPLMKGMSLESERKIFIIACRYRLHIMIGTTSTLGTESPQGIQDLMSKHSEIDSKLADACVEKGEIGKTEEEQIIKQLVNDDTEAEKAIDFLDLVFIHSEPEYISDIIKKNLNTDDEEYRLVLTHSVLERMFYFSRYKSVKNGIEHIKEPFQAIFTTLPIKHKFSILSAAIGTGRIERVEWVKDLIDDRTGDIDASDVAAAEEYKIRAVLQAIKTNNLEIVEQVKGYIDSMNNEQKLEIMLQAIKTNNLKIVKQVKDYIDIDSMNNEQKLEIMLQAIKTDNGEIVEQVKDYIDISSMDNKQKLVIILAATKYCLTGSIFDTLTDEYIDIGRMDNEQKLQIIITTFQLNRKNIFHQLKAYIGRMDNEQKLQIMLQAIENKNLEIVKQVKGYIDISSMDNKQKLQIMLQAIKTESLEVFKQVEGYIDIGSMDNEQKLQLMLQAIKTYRLEIFQQVKSYIEIGSMDNKQKLQIILVAIQNDHKTQSRWRGVFEKLTTKDYIDINSMNNEQKLQIILATLQYDQTYIGGNRKNIFDRVKKRIDINSMDNEQKLQIILAAIQYGWKNQRHNSIFDKVKKYIKIAEMNGEYNRKLVLAAIERGDNIILLKVIEHTLNNLPQNIDERMKKKAMCLLSEDNVINILDYCMSPTFGNYNCLLSILKWGAFERLSEENKKTFSLKCLKYLLPHLEQSADATLFAVMMYSYMDNDSREKLSSEDREKLHTYIGNKQCNKKIKKAIDDNIGMRENEYNSYFYALQESADSIDDIDELPDDIAHLILEHAGNMAINPSLIDKCINDMRLPETVRKLFQGLKKPINPHTEGAVLAAKEAIGTGHGSEAELEPGI